MRCICRWSSFDDEALASSRGLKSSLCLASRSPCSSSTGPASSVPSPPSSSCSCVPPRRIEPCGWLSSPGSGTSWAEAHDQLSVFSPPRRALLMPHRSGLQRAGLVRPPLASSSLLRPSHGQLAAESAVNTGARPTQRALVRPKPLPEPLLGSRLHAQSAAHGSRRHTQRAHGPDLAHASVR